MEWTPARMRLLREVGLCLSQHEFAKAMGFAKRTVGNAERGARQSSLALRRALDQVLENATAVQRDRFLAALDADRGAGLAPSLTFSGAIRDSETPAVTAEMARDLLAVSGCYRRAYRAMPAEALLDTSYAHLSLVLSLQPAWQTPPVRHLLLRSVGESAVLTAVLLLADLARYSDALPYLALAQDAARENDDPDLTAVVLACRAFLTSFSGDSPVLAADFAEAAVNASIEGGAGPTTRGWVAAVSSEQLAVLGDEQRSRTRLEAARNAVAESEPDREWAGVGTFDLAKVTAYEGGDLVRLGRHGDAVTVLDNALAALEPTMHRHRCTALIDRAEAHLAAGQVDVSCGDAAAALTIAVHTGHTLSVQRVHRLAKATLPTNAAAARRLWADVLTATPPFRSSPPFR